MITLRGSLRLYVVTRLDIVVSSLVRRLRDYTARKSEIILL